EARHDAAQRRGARRARADLFAPDDRPLLLRHRHADARGARRPRAQRRGDPHADRRGLARLPLAAGAAPRREGPEARLLRRRLLQRVPRAGRRRRGGAPALAVPDGRRRGGLRALPAPAGMLDRAALAREVAEGRIDTVVTALPDLYGRLVGKRIHAPYFLAEVLGHGMHVCDYLLACDMEMDPT